MSVSAIISVIAFAVLLYLALQMRNSIARNYGSNTQKRAWSDIVFGGGPVRVESDEERVRIGPSPQFWDTSDLDPPENDEELSERIGFDFTLLKHIREITGGKLSQFHAYSRLDEDWVLPTTALAIDVEAPALSNTFNILHGEPRLEDHHIFITSQRIADDDDESAHIAVLAGGAPLEPYRMAPAAGDEEEATPTRILAALTAWHETHPFRIDWVAPDGVELAFYEPPDNLEYFLVHEVYPICPAALDHDPSRAATVAEHVERDRRLILKWP